MKNLFAFKKSTRSGCIPLTYETWYNPQVSGRRNKKKAFIKHREDLRRRYIRISKRKIRKDRDQPCSSFLKHSVPDMGIVFNKNLLMYPVTKIFLSLITPPHHSAGSVMKLMRNP